MKHNLITFFLLACIIFSCKKNENNPVPPAADNYLTTTSGSSWNYHATDNTGAVAASDYTLTSTSVDTSIGGKTYHVFTNSAGGSEYKTITGHDYYQFDSLPTGIGSAAIDRLYLKDDIAVGGNWTQNVSVSIPGSPIPVPFTITNTIVSSGMSKTINGVVYNNVIHVFTQISSALIPSTALVTNIDSYYAKKYGLIENTNIIHLNYLGIVEDVDSKTSLMSAILK